MLTWTVTETSKQGETLQPSNKLSTAQYNKQHNGTRPANCQLAKTPTKQPFGAEVSAQGYHTSGSGSECPSTETTTPWLSLKCNSVQQSDKDQETRFCLCLLREKAIHNMQSPNTRPVPAKYGLQPAAKTVPASQLIHKVDQTLESSPLEGISMIYTAWKDILTYSTWIWDIRSAIDLHNVANQCLPFTRVGSQTFQLYAAKETNCVNTSRIFLIYFLWQWQEQENKLKC